MKTRKLNLLLVFLLLLPLGVVLLGTGCKKEETRDDNLVVKEFPILYMGYNLKPEKTVIIRDQETFDKVFSKELVTQFSVMQNIDFFKYDVLVGENFYTRGITKLEHRFTQSGNSYLYKLSVIYNDALPAGNFCYGIIINKLPAEANVKFEVTKI
ncbi:MAG TPA: hypothetical protein PK167_01335 [Prolixibacteraceae bacterium]|nr:hypothetical protein [Prolixibacteraceae bacterium]